MKPRKWTSGSRGFPRSGTEERSLHPGAPTPRPPLDAADGCPARAPRLPPGPALPESVLGRGWGPGPPLMRLHPRAWVSTPLTPGRPRPPTAHPRPSDLSPAQGRPWREREAGPQGPRAPGGAWARGRPHEGPGRRGCAQQRRGHGVTGPLQILRQGCGPRSPADFGSSTRTRAPSPTASTSMSGSSCSPSACTVHGETLPPPVTPAREREGRCHRGCKLTGTPGCGKGL